MLARFPAMDGQRSVEARIAPLVADPRSYPTAHARVQCDGRPRHCTPEPVLAATGRALADVAFFSKRAIRYRYQSVVPMFEASRNPYITRDTLLKRRFEISQKFGFWTICIWTICLWMICKNLDDLPCDVTKTSPEITPKNLIERLYELRKVVHGMNDAVDICTRCLTSN